LAPVGMEMILQRCSSSLEDHRWRLWCSSLYCFREFSGIHFFFVPFFLLFPFMQSRTLVKRTFVSFLLHRLSLSIFSR